MSLFANDTTALQVICRIQHPSYIPGSANLLRVDATGRTLANLGTLRDDGTAGDAEANDGMFTTVTNVREAAPGFVRLRVSVALRGVLQRVLSDTLTVPVQAAQVLPPEPSVVAPKLPAAGLTTVAERVEFLYRGVNPVQRGVDSSKLVAQRTVVFRGRVLRKDGQPLAGVRVSAPAHPEFGYTLTRENGWFDLVANGGGHTVLQFEKAGYFTVQRKPRTDWLDFHVLEDVVLQAPDPAATVIELTSPFFQVARGSLVTDIDGSRKPTIFFQPGTQASMIFPDNSARPITRLTVRSTEYTVGNRGPNAMPAELPPASRYTYASELTVDEAVAAGALSVRFSKPVVHYLENFNAMLPGSVLPLGFYDRLRHQWIPADNGRAVLVAGIVNGLAVLSLNAQGTPLTTAERSELGVTEDEERQVALLYRAGQSLWRVPMDHFSSPDINIPGGLPTSGPTGGEESPDAGVRSPGTDAIKPCPPESGSRLDCTNQVLGKGVAITGTPWGLHYASDRVPGRRTGGNTLQIRVTGNRIPSGVRQVRYVVQIAGLSSAACVPPAPNTTVTWTWNGLDGWGRMTYGAQPYTVVVEYMYQSVGFSAAAGGTGGGSSGARRAFGAFSQIPGVAFGRGRTFDYGTGCIPFLQGMNATQAPFRGVLGGGDSRAQSVGGWAFTPHHFYDPAGKTLLLGDGARRSLDSVQLRDRIVEIAHRKSPFNSDVGFGDGGPVSQATLFPERVLAAPDGSIYVINQVRIRRIKPDQTVETVIGNGISAPAGDNGDDGLAAMARLTRVESAALGADGSLYFTDEHRIRRIGPDGIVRAFAGGFTAGFSGDGGPALAARLNSPAGVAAAPDGTVYITDRGNRRIRRIGVDGIITSISGASANLTELRSGVPAFNEPIGQVYGIAIHPDGSIYFCEEGLNTSRIRRINPEGYLFTVAGTASTGYSGDDGPAAQAQLSGARYLSIASDGTVYFIDAGNYLIRKIASNGLIFRVAGTTVPRQLAFNGYGGPALATNMNSPRGISASPDGTIYFTEPAFQELLRIVPAFSGVGTGEVLVASEDGGEVYAFNQSGRHTRTINPWTGVAMLTFGYDLEGRLLSVQDAYGNVTRVERNTAGEPVAIVSPYGQRTVLATTSGFLATITDPAGQAYQFSYATGGLLTTITDPRGNRNEYRYDPDGRLLSASDPAGGSKTLSRTGTDSTWRVGLTTAMGRARAYSFDGPTDAREVITGTDTQGFVTTITRTPNTESVDTPEQAQFNTVLNPDPRWGAQAPLPSQTARMPSGLTNSASMTRSVSLQDATNPFSLTEVNDTVVRNGNMATSRYAGSNRTFTRVSAGSRVSTAQLDANGRLIRTQFASFHPVQYEYDARGRLSRMSQGTGAESRVMTFDYDSNGRLASVTDPLGRSAAMTYDAAGRLNRQTMTDGKNVAFGYDANGNVTSLTPPDRPAHTFRFDKVNQVDLYTAPGVAGGGTNAFETQYNPDREAVAFLRPDSLRTTVAYDAKARLLELGTPAGVYRLNWSDFDSRLQGMVAPGGVNLAFTYDGSLLKDETWTGPVSGTVTRTRFSSFRMQSVTVNGANPVAYTYDRDELPLTAGDLTITRSRATGLVERTALGVVTDSIGYNGFGERASYSASAGSTELYAYSFTRDALGRIAAKTETIGGAPASYRYEYDLGGRLRRVFRDNVQTDEYTYGENGNRIAHNGVNATFDTQDRLLTYGGAAFTYTPNGELLTKTDGAGTTVYGYDVFGNLRTVTLPGGRQIEYLIDGRNRRIGKRVDGTLVRGWLYQDDLQPIAELDGSGAVLSRFVYADGSNVPAYMIRGGVRYRLVKDHLGSVRLVVNTATGEVVSRVDYDAWGRELPSTNRDFQPFGFAGGLYDAETGFVRFGARDYDAVVGRWTTKDPIGFAGGSSNLYQYVEADPMNRRDTHGLQASNPSSAARDTSEMLFPEETWIAKKINDILTTLDKLHDGLANTYEHWKSELLKQIVPGPIREYEKPLKEVNKTTPNVFNLWDRLKEIWEKASKELIGGPETKPCPVPARSTPRLVNPKDDNPL